MNFDFQTSLSFFAFVVVEKRVFVNRCFFTIDYASSTFTNNAHLTLNSFAKYISIDFSTNVSIDNSRILITFLLINIFSSWFMIWRKSNVCNSTLFISIISSNFSSTLSKLIIRLTYFHDLVEFSSSKRDCFHILICVWSCTILFKFSSRNL